MIDQLDEALRQLLIHELPIRNGDIDVQFKQPKREWSARLSRPTVNIFLYNIRENVKLRQHSPQMMTMGQSASSVTQQRMPIQLNLHYLITAWANEPEDEHSMLTRVLLALYRNPYLTEEYQIGDLREQPGRIEILAAQPDILQDASLFWSALDNEIRPSVVCLVTLAIDPFTPFSVPIVRERELGTVNELGNSQDSGVAEFWQVRGQVRGVSPMRRARAVLVEEDMTINVRHDGSFVIQGLAAGAYTLEITVGDTPPARFALVVPSPTYIFEV